MTILYPLLLAALTSVFWQLTTHTSAAELVGVGDEESERIVGGRPARAGQFPWAAALYYRGSFICTSSIIGSTSVLTAAHCVVDEGGNPLPPDFFYAVANVRRNSPTVRIYFNRVIVHEGYRNVDNDIAIFRSTRPIPFGQDVKPVCVAGPDTDENAYKDVTAMGWGNISPVRFIVYLPQNLHYVNQTVIPNWKCILLGGVGITKTKICATGLFNGICNGDSGGPLVHLSADNKSHVEIGIASYINGIAGCGKISPGVWTRVSSFYEFIMENTAGDPPCVV